MSSDRRGPKLRKGLCWERTLSLPWLGDDEFCVVLDRQQRFRSSRNLNKIKGTSLVREVELEGEFGASEEVDSIL